MFDFIRKKDIWAACDRGLLAKLDNKISYQLKIAQDLAILSHLHESTGLVIGEIGGGDSRILRQLAMNNRCFNIEKFEGKHLGPTGVVTIGNVNIIDAYVGEFDNKIPDSYFDKVFSISVVEHVETLNLSDFFRDTLRVLKPNGLFIHAIDMYLKDEPSAYDLERFDIYKRWILDNRSVMPMGKIYDGPPIFSTDMASNPDNILYQWNTLAPSLSDLRFRAQSVSLMVGGIKTGYQADFKSKANG